MDTCGNCGSRPCGCMRDESHGACEKWTEQEMVPKWSHDTEVAALRSALTAARHDLETSAGLWCTDIEKDGKALPGGFTLSHPSLEEVAERLDAAD